MLPLINRLPLRTTRRAVEDTAKPTYSSLFTFLVAPNSNSSQPTRFAVILSKKISNKAVTRNLLRRQTLAAIQEHLSDHKTGFDVIVLPKKSIIIADYGQIKADVQSLLKQTGIL